MKTLSMTTFLAVVLLLAGVSLAAEDWFDLENCGMCKNLTEDSELFANMTWDNQLFANGLVEVNTVPAAYEERFQKLMARMQAVAARLQAGEQMPLCAMCRSYGALMMAGADMDYFTSGDTHISIISSKDPDVVKMIRTHGQRTIDEYAKWMAAEGAEGQGHDHHH
ncbi:hypothetical protein KKG45_03915 [bacterium]|nr:hypothetical protein [bacterium]MBU1072374.1 hypothetical protein [bacterium]MBU1676891.1 hypothetical protein [bacterium]